MHLPEPTPFGDLAAYGNERSQAVTVMRGGRSVATISADRVVVEGIDGWWISRALVRLPDDRSRGLGSFILRRLRSSIDAISDCRVMLVGPGGYSNESARQHAFYERNGFAPIIGTPGLLMHTWEQLPGEVTDVRG